MSGSISSGPISGDSTGEPARDATSKTAPLAAETDRAAGTHAGGKTVDVTSAVAARGRTRARRLRLVDDQAMQATGATTHTGAPRESRTWLSVENAARVVNMHPTSFRRQLEKNVYRSPDGGTESRFDGIVARKLGGRWKVLLGPRWLNPLSAEGENNNGARATSSTARPEHTGRSGK